MIAEPRCSQRNCIHFRGLVGRKDDAHPVCAAFPGGIPAEIAYGDNPHLRPYRGDHGLRYEKAGQAEPGADFAGSAADVLQIPEGALKVRLPELHQEQTYSCGAVALEAVCRYYSVGKVSQGDSAGEDWFIRKLGATRADGTLPRRLVRLALELGLEPFEHHPMDDARLRHYLDRGVPVVIVCQAWGEPSDYPNEGSGHYIVAIGYDQDHIYFEDPSLKSTRGYLRWEQLAQRWHDSDATGRLYRRWGVALAGPAETAEVILSGPGLT